MKILLLLDQSRKFANNSPLKSVCIYGGTSVPHQISQIKRGVNVLVATPGRLLDFLDKGFISFRYAIIYQLISYISSFPKYYSCVNSKVVSFQEFKILRIG